MDEITGLSDGGIEPLRNRHTTRTCHTPWPFHLQLLLILAAIFGTCRLAQDGWVSASRFHTDVSCNCGDSIVDAKSLQCEFDPIASAWLPPACRDDELIQEFNSAGPGPNASWVYYSDPNKTTTYTYEEVAALADENRVFWTTLRWHIVHCSYNWRKQFRRSVTGVKLEGRFNTIDHLAHCEMVFQKEDDLEAVITHAPVVLHADFVPPNRL